MYWVFINMDNVSDVSVYFPKTFGCSCDRLNTNPLKSFTGFGMSYSHWVFSGSVDARSSFSSWTCIKTVNTFKMCSYTGKCGNICKRRLTNRGSIATPKGVAFVGWQSGVCRQGNQGDMVWGGGAQKHWGAPTPYLSNPHSSSYCSTVWRPHYFDMHIHSLLKWFSDKLFYIISIYIITNKSRTSKSPPHCPILII